MKHLQAPACRCFFYWESTLQSNSIHGDRVMHRALRVLGKILVGVILALAAGVLLAMATGYRVGLDAQRLAGEPACMPFLIYVWHKNRGEAPVRGDYVVARMPKTGLGVGGREGDRIVKLVMAGPGDEVRIAGTELWINGKHTDRLWLAKSLPGKKVGDFDTHRVLGPREFFVMGTTKESFDSRYWGPINREAIIGTAIPVL